MVLYNHQFIPDDAFTVTASNRAFKYGDALFESALILQQKAPLLSYHISRLKKGLKLLEIECPENWNEHFFTNTIKQLCNLNKILNGRCKITVWRSGEGLYQPLTNTAECLIEIFPLIENPLEHQSKSLILGVYDDYPKMIHPLSACKTANAIPYVLAANFAAKNGFDDVLLLNTNDGIADAVSSNIFIIKNNTCYTTEPMNGGVEGTMQSYIIANASSLGIKVDRIPMNMNDVLNADEIMLTNAIQGIKPVTEFQKVQFKNNLTIELLGKLKWLLARDAE